MKYLLIMNHKGISYNTNKKNLASIVVTFLKNNFNGFSKKFVVSESINMCFSSLCNSVSYQ